MKILLHDYGRNAFTYQLAEEFARRGHQVSFAFSNVDTARFQLPEGVTNPSVLPIGEGDALAKSSFFRRFKAEVSHGLGLGSAIERIRPDVVLSGNAPLEAQWRIMRSSRRVKAGFVYWMQDILSLAAKSILPQKLPVVGSLVAEHFERIEKKMIGDSDACVVIAQAFHDQIRDWDVSTERTTIIENWGQVLLPPDPAAVRDWKKKMGLEGLKVILYSGTLGLKHKPELVLELANRLGDRPDTKVVVIAEGTGIDWLRAQVEAKPCPQLLLMPFQPYSMLAVALAAADVLLVLLEPDAGRFCVPSKTLTYMRAGRPIMGAMPADNLASQIVHREDMGLIADPLDADGFVRQALVLLSDPSLAAQMGTRAAAYAEQAFNIQSVGDRFERVLKGAVERTRKR
jgi:glycosyltransferase involved in cell wall biosynthesis